MSKIEEMIRELCPKGVERVKLGEICSELPKGALNMRNLPEKGLYPVLNSGKEITGYNNEYNNDCEAFAIASRGEYAGSVNYVNGKFWAGVLCYPFKLKENSKNVIKYIYYILKVLEPDIMRRLVSRGGIPAINKNDVENYRIPLPPPSVQREIVSVLDSFTTLIDKMKKEVEMRKKQMECYREKIMSFKEGECNWKEIQEVFNMRNGYTPSKSNPEYWENGTIPWFRMEDIRENGHILSDSILHITMDGVKNGRLFPANSFIIATTATIGEHALIIVDSLANQQFTNLTIRKSFSDKLLAKFVFYYLFIVDEWCKNNVNVSGFASVDMGRFKKYKFPLPPLSTQLSIVRTLDAFESYITSMERLITLRQKQYEYYREKLLTFE